MEIDPALNGDPALRPRAPGMKYRHYAPKAPLYLYEGEQAALRLTEAVQRSQKLGLHVGVLCDDAVKTRLEESLRRGHRAEIFPGGRANLIWPSISMNCCVILTGSLRTLSSAWA